MNWLQPVDNYCERLDAGFWSEPLNALTNASFVIAGFLLLRQWRGSEARDLAGLLLVLNVLAIGVGSFLFHTFANRWSALADVAPITVFIHLYFLLALRQFLGMRWWQAGLGTLAFLAASPLIGNALSGLMGSSAFYAPALLAIFGVSLAATGRDRLAARRLRHTGLVFAASIAFRAADQPFCDSLPTGTHLMWHLLNGLVLWMLVSLYLANENARRTRDVLRPG